MADVKEQLTHIEALAKEDGRFRDELTAAIEARDADGFIGLVNSRGFELAADDLAVLLGSGQSIDDAELDSVAGGKGRLQKIYDHCGEFGAFGCGCGLGVALWSPGYESDEGDNWND